MELRTLDLSDNTLKGDEVQWARYLYGDELDEFRLFYTTKDVLIKGSLLLAALYSYDSVFANIPRELIYIIIDFQIHKYLIKRKS